jgi:hypothetical protein
VGFMCLVHLVQDRTTLKHVIHTSQVENKHNNSENTYFQNAILRMPKIKVFWDITPCQLVNTQKHF